MKAEKESLRQNISNANETISKGAGELAIGLPLLLIGTQLILNNIVNYTPDAPADYLSIGIATGTTMLGYFPTRLGLIDLFKGHAELEAYRIQEVRRSLQEQIENQSDSKNK